MRDPWVELLRFKDVGPLQEKASFFKSMSEFWGFWGDFSHFLNFSGMEYHGMVQHTSGCCHLRLRDMMIVFTSFHVFLFVFLESYPAQDCPISRAVMVIDPVKWQSSTYQQKVKLLKPSEAL